MHGDVLHPHTRPQEKCSRGKTSKDTSDGTQTEQKLTKKEFEKLSPEIRALVGDKLKGHKDGDAERLVFEQ